MWHSILFAIFVIGYYALNKRLSQIESSRGKGATQSFRIDVLSAVLKNKRFGELKGIKSAESGKDFKDWGKEDRKKWWKIAKTIQDKACVRLTYLSSEDTYFIQVNNISYMVLPELGKRYLYTVNLTGDDSVFEKSLEFGVVERNIKSGNGYCKVLTAYLVDHFSDIDKKSITNILFDFPIHKQDMGDTDFETLGFKVERSGGDDIYEDNFGEMDGVPTLLTLEKNGAKINFNY